MSRKSHPILAVPIIAFIDAVLMGAGNGLYEWMTQNHSIIPWPDSFWLLFRYTFVIALLAGVVLGPIFVAARKRWPEPKLAWLVLLGALLGPLPLAILVGELPETTALLVFSALGMTSAGLWWLIVESPRDQRGAA